MVYEFSGSAVDSFAKTGGGLLPRTLAALYISWARFVTLNAVQSLRASRVSITLREAATNVSVPSQITS